MKKISPLLLMVVSVIGLLNLPEMYQIPLQDEAFYSQGRYADFPDWGPLYHFAYYCINLITGSRIHSFYLFSGLIGLIFIPLLTYLLATKFLKNSTQAFIIASLSYVVSWNIPSNPKIQIFNFALILIVFILRTPSSEKFSYKTLVSYLILVMSIFCRFDNIIILSILLSYDLWYWFKAKRIKSILAICLSCVTSLNIMLYFFGNPINQNRNWRAFTDHFFWKNPHLFVNNIKPGEDYATLVQKFFNGANSLTDAFLAQPEAIFIHISKNLLHLPFYLWSNFEIPTLPAATAYIIFMFFVFLVFSRTDSDQSFKKNIELKLFILATTLKCFSTALILQPIGKYIFEINFSILLLLANICFPHFKGIKGKIPAKAILVIPFAIGLFYARKPLLFQESVLVNESIKALQKMEVASPIRHYLGNDGFLIWYQSSASHINLWPDRRFDRAMANNLNLFLKEQNIDTVLIDPSQRYLFKIIGVSSQFENFEKHPEEFGFALKHRSYPGPLTIFQRLPN